MWQKSIMKLETNTFYVSWYNSSQLNITVVGDRGEPLSCTICVREREREGALHRYWDSGVYWFALLLNMSVCACVCKSFHKERCNVYWWLPWRIVGHHWGVYYECVCVWEDVRRRRVWGCKHFKICECVPVHMCVHLWYALHSCKHSPSHPAPSPGARPERRLVLLTWQGHPVRHKQRGADPQHACTHTRAPADTHT